MITVNEVHYDPFYDFFFSFGKTKFEWEKIRNLFNINTQFSILPKTAQYSVNRSENDSA